jgi:glycosyltransferase involved in cell wall biosynthesis
VLPDEVVVCDDASDDDTLSIIKQFQRTVAFPIKVFCNQTRLGPAQNFGRALGLCTGELIFLCDQDDIWKPHKIETLSQAMARKPHAAYAFSNAEMMDAQGALMKDTLWHAVGLARRAGQFEGPGQLEILLRHNIVTGAAMTLRASFLKAVLPIPAGWMHDYWVVLIGSALSYGIPIAEPLFFYRRHATQVCGWRKKSFLQVFRDSLRTGNEDWSTKINNFRKVLERIDLSPAGLQCSPQHRALLAEKERHLLTRSQARHSTGPARVGRVLAEACTGRYRRFSNSWYSIVRDL